MTYPFEIVRYRVNLHSRGIGREPDKFTDYTSKTVVYEGSISAANEVAQKRVLNHLAHRSHGKYNGDKVVPINLDTGLAQVSPGLGSGQIGETFRYSVEWRRTPRGRHAKLFRNLARETWF